MDQKKEQGSAGGFFGPGGWIPNPNPSEQNEQSEPVFEAIKFGFYTIISVFISIFLRIALNHIFSVVLSTFLSSALQGVISGALSLIFLANDKDYRPQPSQNPSWFMYLLGGALAGVSLALISHSLVGGPGGGPPPDVLISLIKAFTILLLIAMIALPVIALILNVGLSNLGLGVTAELAEEKGESVGETYMSGLLGIKSWAKECKQINDGPNIWVRSFFIGVVSSSAIFYLEFFAGTDLGFEAAFIVELVGTVLALLAFKIPLYIISLFVDK